MLYYRNSDVSKTRPPELADWVSLSEDAMLHDSVINGVRVCAITPPFMFAPPEDGWVPLCDGWQVVQNGPFTLNAHARSACKYQVKVIESDGKPIMVPKIVTSSGQRAFPVTYGGTGFQPILTNEQTEDLQLASEIRACNESGIWPEMSVQALWAARLLTRPYSLSTATIGMIGILNDKVIEQTLNVAGGYDGE